MKKNICKMISLICTITLLMSFAPAAMAFTETTTINWADASVYTNIKAHNPKTGKGDSCTNMLAAMGGTNGVSADKDYNVYLNPIASANDGEETRSKFAINLGAERNIDYIDIYQWKNRIKTLKVYKLNESAYNTAINSNKGSISDNFFNTYSAELIGVGNFNHGTDANAILNAIDVCNAPDRIEFNTSVNAQYLLFVVTEVVDEGYKASMLQKITVNSCGNIGVTAVKNWADASVYTNIKAHNPKSGKGDSSSHMLAAMGSKDGVKYDTNYNVYLNPITANEGEETRSKFAINLGAERKIDYIDIYQWKNRIKTLKVYKLSDSAYNTAINNNNATISDNFFNTYSNELIGVGNFEHGTNAESILNPIDACNTPDRIEFNTSVNAQYLLFVVTEVVDSGYKASMLQKITVNSVADTLDANALELDVALFQNSGSTQKLGVFAAQKNGETMVKCDLISQDVESLTQLNLFSQKIAVDSEATKIDFIILDMTTLKPLLSQKYDLRKN